MSVSAVSAPPTRSRGTSTITNPSSRLCRETTAIGPRVTAIIGKSCQLCRHRPRVNLSTASYIHVHTSSLFRTRETRYVSLPNDFRCRYTCKIYEIPIFFSLFLCVYYKMYKCLLSKNSELYTYDFGKYIYICV